MTKSFRFRTERSFRQEEIHGISSWAGTAS